MKTENESFKKIFISIYIPQIKWNVLKICPDNFDFVFHSLLIDIYQDKVFMKLEGMFTNGDQALSREILSMIYKHSYSNMKTAS